MLTNIMPIWTGAAPTEGGSPNAAGWDHVTVGAPDAKLGADGDTAFDGASATGAWYLKTGGTWVLRGHLKGDPGAPGPVGPKGEPGAALNLVEQAAGLTTGAIVPLVTLPPRTWVQSIVATVVEPADAASVSVRLLDDGLPIAFANDPSYATPSLECGKAGATVSWPAFMSLDGGQLSLEIVCSGGTTGSLRCMVVHGLLDPAA